MKDLIQERLEIASSSCEDPVRRALIDAERAYHFARVGRFSDARALLTSIRSLQQAKFNPAVAIWIILSEGILAFFEDLDPNAYDRFRRAYALSVSIGDFELQALVLAWLAHIEFNVRSYPEMVSSASRCLAIYDRASTAAHARLFMVFGNANLYAGNVSKSSLYFERARSIAVNDGDRATVGAIVYNRAALMLNNFRLQPYVEFGESIDLGLVSVAVDSSSAFQDITANKSLSELPVMNQARLAMVKGDYAFALAAIDKIRSSEHRHRGGAKDPLLDIEYAACLVECGKVEHAGGIVQSIDFSRTADLDFDDQIVFFAHLLAISDRMGVVAPMGDAAVLMGVAVKKFSDELSRLRGAVDSMNSLLGRSA